MPSTNGHSPKRAILYARVSTDEQARTGYSLAQQLERGRQWCAQEGYKVLREVMDAGHSGATLERPGMDEIRDVVARENPRVDLVWAQDADRITREPYHRALLDDELAAYGTRLLALDDWGDDSHEGGLLKFLKGWQAKGERLKTAERSRRGKLRKAREGKIIATMHVNFGFSYNEQRDAYIVREDHMDTVRRVFRMVALEGATLYRVKKALELEGTTPPKGGRCWNKKTLREMILDDVYKPHTPVEIGGLVNEGLMSREVAAGLDPERCYGIWWYNRRRTVRTRAKRADGSYYWKQNVRERPRSDWVAVPVPDAGVPREQVDAARESIKDNVRPSDGGYRYWELASVMVCGVCGCRMSKTRRTKGRNYEGYYYYYFCPTRVNKGQDACPQLKGYRAEHVETQVWELVRSMMLDPDHLLGDIEQMIEEERTSAVRGDPEREAGHWFDKLGEVDSERRGFLRLAARGSITDAELDEALAELEDLRETAERELRAIEGRKDALRQLERDRDALKEHYARIAPEALDALTPEERHQLYKILRLRVTADADRKLTAEGMFGDVSVHDESSTWVMPLRRKSSSNSSGMSERSPRTIPRTTAASCG
jgi:site-specific DNA recombinase